MQLWIKHLKKVVDFLAEKLATPKLDKIKIKVN